MPYTPPQHVLEARARRAVYIAEAERELAETLAFFERMEKGGYTNKEPAA